MQKAETVMDLFRIEEARIDAEMAESEKYYERTIREKEKIRDAAKVEREKAQGALPGIIADFEKREVELEAKELKRLNDQCLTKAALKVALDEGRISAAEFLAKGITDAEVAKRIQAAVAERLKDFRDAIRAQGIKLLELEVAEFEGERDIMLVKAVMAAAFREQAGALHKALEASLNSRLGLGGMPAIMAQYNAKALDLRVATNRSKPGDSIGWTDYDLAGLKRLRLNPIWPASELPKLEELIAKAKMTGRKCRVQITGNQINMMWELDHARR